MYIHLLHLHFYYNKHIGLKIFYYFGNILVARSDMPGNLIQIYIF